MNAIYKELSDEAFLNIALGGNYFKLAHLDEQLGEIVHQVASFLNWILSDRTCKHAQTK